MSTSRPGWSGGDPEDFTALTVVRTSLVLARVFSATLSPYPLTPQEFSVLMHLVEQPGRSQADLARDVMATPQSVGELVRTMEKRGLVERTPPPGPGLAFAVSASAAGHELLDEVTPHVLAAFSATALGLDDAAYDRLNVDLHTILAVLST